MGTATLVKDNIETIGGSERTAHYRLDPPLHDWVDVLVSTYDCPEHGAEGSIFAGTEDSEPAPLPFLIPLTDEAVPSFDHDAILAAAGYSVVVAEEAAEGRDER